ncbi:putative carbonic anhydrase [Mycena crocata]|nr:putative carbonic anhydrase [Mycena crocata]
MFSSSTIALILAASALSVSANCMHGTTFSRRVEGEVPISKFGYTGLQGPLNWAGLEEANSACRKSSVQSPIVLSSSDTKASEAPKVEISNVEEAEFENLGTTLEVVVKGKTTVGGKEFELQQFHMHTPSEHRINDEYFPLEIHMVHQASDASIAVIAIPFQLTEDSSTTELLTSVIENIDKVTEPGTATTTGPLDFAPLIEAIQSKALFQYTGSLTTPPCAEGLTFLVMEEPLPINVKTYNAIKKVIKFNARYSQNTLGETNLLAVASNLTQSTDGCTQSTKGSSMEMVSMEKVVTHCNNMCHEKKRRDLSFLHHSH